MPLNAFDLDEELQRNRDLRREQRVAEALVFDGELPPLNAKPKHNKNDALKDTLKNRHMNKRERDMYHKPHNDWTETKRGDVCKSSYTLEINDILKKHNIE